MSVSRRGLFKTLLKGLGAGVFGGWANAVARAENPPSTSGPLITRVTRPFDAETPVREFTTWLTPNERLFIRSHFGPPNPDVIDPTVWRLKVGGKVGQQLSLSLKELKQFEAVTVTSVLQCSGNGRAFHSPKVPGVQWERGAVGNVEWTGVRLKDVLAKAELKSQAKHVQFLGADRPVLASVPLFVRSIPIEKALHPDTLLAFEMNGRPLPLLHGAPLRVITPGWMAESCIKWLTEITAQVGEATGYYMQQAYRVPVTTIGQDSGLPEPRMLPVEEMPVKSLVITPGEGDTVKVGPVSIQGVGWTGEARIAKVEVSVDGGKTWEAARLVGEEHPYAWRQWQFVWNAKNAGTATVLCRATDSRGETQPQMTPWNPSGFLWNGWDRVTVIVRGEG
ncbi:sulfite oxidase [Petrachloros mirabilis]